MLEFPIFLWLNQTACHDPDENLCVFIHRADTLMECISPPNISPSRRHTKEHHQDHSLFLTESRCLCGAAPLFVEKALSCARLLNAICDLNLLEARWIREEVRVENRSEEKEEPQGALRTFREWEPDKKILLLSLSPGFFSRWQAPHYSSVDGRLAHKAFRNQSAMLLNSY